MEHLFHNVFQIRQFTKQNPDVAVSCHTVFDVLNEARRASFDTRMLLDRTQSHVIWAGIVTQVMNERVSHNILPSARSLRDAYDLLQANSISPDDDTLLSAAFAAFTERCSKQGVVAHVDIPQGIAEGTLAGRVFHVHGHHHQPNFIDALEGAGATLHFDSEPSGRNDIPKFSAASTVASSQAIALSVASLFAGNDEQPNVALVVNSEEEAAQLEQALRPVLCPSTLNGGSAYWDVPWRLAQPSPLIGSPWVSRACDILGLGSGWNETAKVSALLLDQGAFTKDEFQARAQVDWWLRENSGGYLSLQRLVEMLERANAPKTAAAFAFIRDGGLTGKQSFSQWRQTFEHCLGLFGWLELDVHDGFSTQLRSLWDKALDKFTGLELVMGDAGKDRALAWLREVCLGIQWQPESAIEQPIVIGTARDIDGLSFDHVVWCDASTGSVPHKVIQNPFVSEQLLVNAQLPDRSPEAMTEAMQRQIDTLSMAGNLTAWCAEYDARGAVLIPSPLFGDWKNAETFIAEAAPTAPRVVDDRPAPACPPEQRQFLRGGSSLLSNAVHSPFYALMRNRLHVQALEPTAAGITAKLQGILVHRVLENFWMRHTSSVELKAMSETELASEVGDCIDVTFSDDALLPVDRFGEYLVRLERDRLLSLVTQWLKHEQARELEWEIFALEKEFKVDIDGYVMRCKIDRIDKVIQPDGSTRLLLIDYKTGASTSFAGWKPESFKDPQLPAYVAFGESALGLKFDGIAFGQVHDSKVGFQVVSNFAGRLVQDARGGMGDVTSNWDVRRDEWRDACLTLAGKVFDGITTVDMNESTPNYLSDLAWYIRCN